MDKNYLEQFFLVTTSPGTLSTSLYRVSSALVEGDRAVVKIDLKGTSGIPLGAHLVGGLLVGITTFHVFVYNNSHGDPRQRPDKIVDRRRGEHTSLVAGLFLQEEEARLCFATDPLNHWDPRFAFDTIATLKAITDQHPYFKLEAGLAAFSGQRIGGISVEV